jgi:glycosyltransferase involved in cell wall biosynthesis
VTGPDDAQPAVRRLLAKALGPWRLQLRNYYNKAVYGPRLARVRRFEDAEVARLAAANPPPEALVATIIVTYRRPKTLLRAIESALAQSVTDQVVLVMDDGGGLPDLPSDPRLRGYSLSANSRRPSVVRNIGIRLSRSAYVAFLDDDNEWEPNHLRAALEAFGQRAADPHPDLVYTALRRVFPDGTPLDILSVPFDRRALARRGYIDTNSIVARRCPHLIFSRMQLGVLKPPSDWEIIWRMSRRHTVMHVDTPTVRYLVNPDSYFSDWQGDGVVRTDASTTRASKQTDLT